MKGVTTLLGRINDTLNRLEGRSLSNTKPLFIKASTGTTFSVNGYAIKAVGSDVSFNSLVVDNKDGSSDDFSNMTILAGDTVYLNISSLDISAGEAIVYQR